MFIHRLYFNFALQESEASEAFTAWTGFPDNGLITKLEMVEGVHAVGEALLSQHLSRDTEARQNVNVSCSEHATS